MRTLRPAADKIIDQIASWCDIPDLHERIVVRRTMGPGNFESELNAWSGTRTWHGPHFDPERIF